MNGRRRKIGFGQNKGRIRKVGRLKEDFCILRQVCKDGMKEAKDRVHWELEIRVDLVKYTFTGDKQNDEMEVGPDKGITRAYLSVALVGADVHHLYPAAQKVIGPAINWIIQDLVPVGG